jgi:23S rRNA (pseudouridine1915-N3)-methyltransferase
LLFPGDKLIPMKLTLAAIGLRARSTAHDELTGLYRERTAAYSEIEITTHRSSQAFFENLDKQRARTAPILILLDSSGKQLSSENLAQWIGRQRDDGQQRIVFAIGPADGWSPEEKKRASLLLSLGPMTLPHELARLVLSEQIYRAFTILNGHPYHTGH